MKNESLCRRNVLVLALVFASTSAFYGPIFEQPLSAQEQSTDNKVVDAKVRKAEQSRIAAIAKASKSAVCVFSPGGRGGGSGVLFSKDGFALTNYHVVKPCGTYMQCSLNDGKLYDAVLVGVDPVGDVAIIQLLGRDDFPAATLADSDKVRAGQWCFAVGNPFLLATDFQPTVTWGIVSGVNRYQPPAGTLLEYTDCIQTDAAINPGNSGGPLFNADGDVIGINGRGSFEKRGRVNVGVGYAISINQIKYFMDHLMSGRIVDHATLGATVYTDPLGRVLVDSILESSDAYKKGLRYEDQIISFAGRAISTTNQYKNILGIFPKGWRVPIVFRRDGQNYEINVRLTGVHDESELTEMIQGKAPPAGAAPQAKPQSAIPDSALDLIKNRRGYANYYFNQKRRNEIWKSFVGERTSSTFSSKAWKLSGRMDDGSSIEIVLDNEKSGFKWADDAYTFDQEDDVSSQLFPRQTSGLLPGLHLWRRLLVNGPEKFGSVSYFGSIPLNGNEKTFDVFTATYNVAETQFFFDKSSGQLMAMEMYSDPELDPLEARFEDVQVLDGVPVPMQLRFRYAGRWATIKFNKFEVVE